MTLPYPDKELGFEKELVTAAVVRARGNPGLDMTAIEARTPELEQREAALIETAKADFGIDFANIQPPFWLDMELKSKKPITHALHQYVSKELCHADFLRQNLTPLMQDAPPGPIADIGARSGFFPHLLRQQHDISFKRHISGLDLKQHLPTEGNPDYDFRQGPNPLVKTYDGITMPYKDDSLAIATLNCVLHHVEDPSRTPSADSPALMRFLGEVKRSLKPGGTLLITEDFMGRTQADRLKGNPYVDTVLATDDMFYPKSPGCQRSQEEWVAILKSAGFAVDLEKHVGNFNVAGLPSVVLVIKAHKPIGEVTA